MLKIATMLIAALSVAGHAGAATITNKDADTAVLVVVEGESRIEVAIASGASEEICLSGCFITTPSGDRIGLEGGETVEIVNGSALIK